MATQKNSHRFEQLMVLGALDTCPSLGAIVSLNYLNAATMLLYLT